MGQCPICHYEIFEYEFTTAQFDINIPVRMSIVNHEAREVALDWVQKQAVPATLKGSKVVKQFDPQVDALFLPAANFDEFVENCLETNSEAHNNAKSSVKNIAISEAAVLDSDDMRGILRAFPQLKALYIVVDCNLEEPDETHWCELGSRSGGVFVWNAETRVFDFVDSENGDPQASTYGPRVPSSHCIWDDLRNDLDRSLDAIGYSLGMFKKIKSFEVRPVAVCHRRK
ncbi:hypothetical protein K461DRAFT_282951 [Myriangium duriaei CBS 260.36]|uniref:Uncharacterized protein n=1 Tax=Myriangium duriaei CBS 260.36 TaxID=1168546 RepID=A0A9P4IU82_9PEZI|nr:hypothetical protein K461DRAFT_282951 [Myriangium duriaei CBS 260.36]